ncbi:MAG: sulfotransferase [Chitinophagales bacterium]|nr:sulfotransferase [Chitinophagales bacterium]
MKTTPLFLISQPRSGSTLLQAILSNNAQIATQSEPWLLLPFLSWEDTNTHKALYGHHLAVKGIQSFVHNLPEKQADFSQEMSRFFTNLYTKAADGATYFLDKTPRYYEILPQIQTYFPAAKIIILKRNPFAVLNSIIDTFSVNSYDKLFNFRRDILHAPFLLEDFRNKNMHNATVQVVHYENLVKNPETTVAQLMQWLEVPFSPQMLHYQENESYKGNLGDPVGVHKHTFPKTDSLGQWKEKLQTRQWQRFFKAYANFLGNDFLEKYGNYSFENPQKWNIFNRFVCYDHLDAAFTDFSLKYQIRKRIYQISGVDVFKKK